MHIPPQKPGSNPFHWKWLLCTILWASLREAGGGQMRYGSGKLELLRVTKLPIMTMKFWVCALVWPNKRCQTMKLAPAGAVICLRLQFAWAQTYGEICLTAPDNPGLVRLVRPARKVASPWCWMGFDPASQLRFKGCLNTEMELCSNSQSVIFVLPNVLPEIFLGRFFLLFLRTALSFWHSFVEKPAKIFYT